MRFVIHKLWKIPYTSTKLQGKNLYPSPKLMGENPSSHPLNSRGKTYTPLSESGNPLLHISSEHSLRGDVFMIGF